MRKLGKQKIIGQIITLCLISTLSFATVFLENNAVKAVEMEGEQVEIKIDQEIEKYFNLNDEQILLQQRIVVTANQEEFFKKGEKLKVHVPELQGKMPNSAVVLVNGDKAEEAYYSYVSSIGELEIEIPDNKKSSNTYKIIYHYTDMQAEIQNITLHTIVYTMIENQEEIETIDEKKLELNTVGDKISIQGTITQEVYKGYLYEAKQNSTFYDENYMLEISNIENIEEMNLLREKEKYTYETQNGEEITKVEKDTNQSTYFIQTSVNKAQMLKILGQEGKMTIQTDQGEIYELTKDTQEDENGNLVIHYNNVKDISIATSKPVELGELMIEHKKAIAPNIGYEKAEIKKFEYLEDTLRMNNKVITLTMNLLDTKAEATIELSQANLSTLQKNEDIQMIATLKTNQSQYDLYKNPYLEIVFPTSLEVEVKSINLVDAPNWQINRLDPFKNEQGETVLPLKLQGEQTQFENSIVDGIHIVFTVDITGDILTPTQKAEIKMKYTNENRESEVNEVKQQVNLQSKQGALLVQRINNLNSKQEVIQSTNDKIVKGELDIGSEARQVNMEFYFLNNEETTMEQPTIIGRIPNLGTWKKEEETVEITIEEKLENFVTSSKMGAKIYYSEDANAQKDSETWKEDIEDISKIKAFKVEFETNCIEPKEVVKISYPIEIPENLEPSMAAINTLEVDYEQLGSKMSISSTNILKTPDMAFEEASTLSLKGEQKDIKVQMAAISAGKALKDGDEIYEGQAIRYTLQVTNNTENVINNLKMVANHTNVIYYGVRMEWGTNEQYPYFDEQEDLTNKEITIDNLAPSETTTIEYQIVANKEVSEGTKTSGEIVLTGEGIEETTIQAYTNPIKQAKLKLKLLSGYSIEQDLYTGGSYPLEFYIENITEEDLSNIEVLLDTNGLLNCTKQISSYPSDAKITIEDSDNTKLKLKIDSLAKGEKIIIHNLNNIRDIDITEKEVDIDLNFKATVNEEVYTSNQLRRIIQQGKTKVEILQSGSIDREYVEDGDNLIYTTVIKNTGVIDFLANITDFLPEGVNINIAYLMKNGVKEGEVSVIYQDATINRIVIEPGETVEFVVDTTIDVSSIEGDKISNVVSVSGQQSNEITYQVKREQESPDEPDEPDDPNNPANPDNPDDPTPEQNKRISGVAWIDENRDGEKADSESRISNMEIYLLDQKSGVQVMQTNTNEKGEYQFDNLEKGTYLIVFNYNAEKYQITQYQKQGINENRNSDVIDRQITINGQSKKVATTQGIELSTEDLINIDAGFIPKKVFNLSLDKSIGKIAIQNSQGTTIQGYDKAHFAKVELKSKIISGSTVLVEYQIQIKNEGEIAGYATEIVDNMPSDFKFSTEINKDWYQKTDGKIATNQLANQIINPGETKTITLVLTKTMTQNNTGTSVNIAEISKQSNELSMQDENNTDNQSKAELIISIATGEMILHITLILVVGILLCAGIYFIIKKVLKT